ncbi:hypothetical protein WAI453_000954 [Rhynchosporium graminicola]
MALAWAHHALSRLSVRRSRNLMVKMRMKLSSRRSVCGFLQCLGRALREMDKVEIDAQSHGHVRKYRDRLSTGFTNHMPNNYEEWYARASAIQLPLQHLTFTAEWVFTTDVQYLLTVTSATKIDHDTSSPQP